VQPTEYVLDMDRAGCRIVWDYLAARAQPGSREAAALAELNPLVSLADDVDRWVLKVPSSRDVALAVNSMPQDEAFDALMTVDADLRWPRSLRQAMRSVRGEIEASLELAESTRTSGRAAHEDVNVVAAECTGYAGEVAERWKSKCKRTVFALLDRRAQAVSLRRTEDCPVDLSRLAASFGGGGHAAAAGFDPEPQTRNATAVARAVVIRLDEHQEGGLG
jgi:oligoribonuclease NrnB/cAMP/cGMP phosphodiesterase (DHH superfamily)